MKPVIRVAGFKYKADVTQAQKQDVYDRLIKLYETNAHLVNHGPRRKHLGGLNDNYEGFDEGFDAVFTVEVKSQKHRDEFNPEPNHAALKDSIMPSVKDVMVYDFEDSVL